MQNFLQGIHTYIINLDSRPDRWDSIQKQIRFLKLKSVERFSAINRRQIDSELFENFCNGEWRNDRGARYDDTYIAGTVACLQSHLACIRDAKEKNYPCILILEDDAEFRGYTLRMLNKVAKQIQGESWGLFYLGGSMRGRAPQKKISKNLFKVAGVKQTHAYMIHHSVYDKILLESPKCGLPIDWYYSDILQYEQRCLAIFPFVAFQKDNELSDISDGVVHRYKTLKKLKRKLRDWIRSLR